MAAEVSELQQEIIRLQDTIESTIDDRRHVDIEMSKLDRKVKMDKALAIDQHHQKVQQYRLPARCVWWCTHTHTHTHKRLLSQQTISQISQVDEMIEDIVDVLYDYEEQLEG